MNDIRSWLLPDLVHISRPYCTEGSYQNYPQREITHDGGLENFIRGTGITLASEFSGVCIHRTSSVYTHTHTPRESRHTLDSLFILVSRDWVVFFFSTERIPHRFLSFCGSDPSAVHDPHPQRRWQTPDRTTRTPPKSPLYRRKTCDVTHRTGQHHSARDFQSDDESPERSLQLFSYYFEII